MKRYVWLLILPEAAHLFVLQRPFASMHGRQRTFSSNTDDCNRENRRYSASSQDVEENRETQKTIPESIVA